jgi:TRAP-type C4-dicarboxylate transport system permease small subunit
VIFAIAGIGFFFALFFNNELWQEMNSVHNRVINLPEWIKYIPGLIIGLVILFVLFRQAVREYRAEKNFSKGR